MGGFEWCEKRIILYRAVNVTSQHASTAQLVIDNNRLLEKNRLVN